MTKYMTKQQEMSSTKSISSQTKTLIINANTFKLKNYFNLLDKFTNDLYKINEVSNFDTQQITILKQIAVHYFYY